MDMGIENIFLISVYSVIVYSYMVYLLYSIMLELCQIFNYSFDYARIMPDVYQIF